MPLVGQDTWTLLEDLLVNEITSQTALGGNPAGVLAVQPNPDGSSGIKFIGRIVPPEQEIFPQIAVQCLEYDEDPTATNTHAFVGRFLITIAVRQSHDPAIADTGNAALQNLRNYQNDGSGNGLSPLLRQNVTLSSLCQWSGIKKMERFVVKSEADDSDSIATAVYTFETHDQIRIT